MSIHITPLNQTDFYKVSHQALYPQELINNVTNLTPRKSKLKRPDGSTVNKVVVAGIQFFCINTLIESFKDFFDGSPEVHTYLREKIGTYNEEQLKTEILKRHQKKIDRWLGPGVINNSHLERLWDLGFLPLTVRALEEGTLCPIGVPLMTIEVSEEYKDIPLSEGGFAWLPNFLETISSTYLWPIINSATIAYEFKKSLLLAAIETGGSEEFVNFQGHDFSMRGMFGLEAAAISGFGHLLSFYGTDTIPAIEFAEQFYPVYDDSYLIGTSVVATEHSVMCAGTKEDEFKTFERLIDLAHKNNWPILSIVSDTWDLWQVITNFLPRLKDKIINGPTKVVIRPDSGDPVDIICGLNTNPEVVEGEIDLDIMVSHPGPPEYRGVIELLYDIFGGIINEKGYIELHPKIGAIYGDSITLERAYQICKRLKSKKFSSTNVVLGIGSFTYQGGGFVNGEPYFVTRDLFGFAVKSTYVEVEETFYASAESLEPGTRNIGRAIFKDPVTDDGTKKSAKGLLKVIKNDLGELELKQECTFEEYVSEDNLLKPVFHNGTITRFCNIKDIREKLWGK